MQTPVYNVTVAVAGPNRGAMKRLLSLHDVDIVASGWLDEAHMDYAHMVGEDLTYEEADDLRVRVLGIIDGSNAWGAYRQVRVVRCLDDGGDLEEPEFFDFDLDRWVRTW